MYVYIETAADGISCAMFALANKHYDIVSWLETQGAEKHKILNGDFEQARQRIEASYDGWMD